MNLKKTLLICFSSFCFFSFGQEQVKTELDQEIEIDSIEAYKVKRISAGIKLGIPNIAGFSLEGITPLLGNRIAPYVDYSSFPVNTDETEVDLKYTELGSNFYFGDEGKGFYAGIGFGTLNTDITFNDIQFEENGNRGRGTGSIETKINTTNIKFGVKTGGRIYFRLEVGYGIGTIPENITVNGTFTFTDEFGNTQTESGSEIEEFPSIPGVNKNGVLVGNFGFGVSF
ncbi:MAG: hypothetical protein P8M60_06665 [Flavobacteriaceae bacterium]|nr:hypothetical protein [Flavobacteriaceae bacterium]